MGSLVTFKLMHPKHTQKDTIQTKILKEKKLGNNKPQCLSTHISLTGMKVTHHCQKVQICLSPTSADKKKKNEKAHFATVFQARVRSKYGKKVSVQKIWSIKVVHSKGTFFYCP